MRRIIAGSFIFIFIFVQYIYAFGYPLNKDEFIKELGQEYFDLRSQLPYDDAGNIFIDQALIKGKENIDILFRLLNDKNITKNKDVSLLEGVNINSSDFIFNECIELFYSIILLIFNRNYESIPQAIDDDFKKLSEEDQKIINSILDERNKFSSIYYQKVSNMSKECADIFAKNYFKIDPHSKKLNKEALDSMKGLIDNGCIHIIIIARYADAIIQEGEFNNAKDEAEEQVMDLYQKYFDKLSDKDLDKPTTLTFFQRISVIENRKGNHESEIEIYKKISKLILSDKIKLENKPQWVRNSYLKLLSKSVKLKELKKIEDKEIYKNLKQVFNKKGNIFILKGDRDDKIYKLGDEERKFIELIQQAE